jgi:hypothetical protein
VLRAESIRGGFTAVDAAIPGTRLSWTPVVRGRAVDLVATAER